MSAYVIRRVRPGAFAGVAAAALAVALMGATGIAGGVAVLVLNVFVAVALVRVWRSTAVVRVDDRGVRLQHHPVLPWAQIDSAVLGEGMLAVRPRGTDDAPAVSLDGLTHDRAALAAALADHGIVLREEPVSE